MKNYRSANNTCSRKKVNKLTKEELSQIYYLNREIIMWQKELSKLESKSLIKGQDFTGMPIVSGISDKTANAAIEKAEIQAIIQGKLTEIQVQRKRIMEYINSIDDSLSRQIIYLRNVSCMKWREVADTIGGNNTEDSVKQAYKRFFEKQSKLSHMSRSHMLI